MKNSLLQVLTKKSAIAHFNFYNLESFNAIRQASAELKKPVIIAASTSAIKYMGADFLRDFASKMAPLHLDHGHSFEDCKNAIELGFSSVMIDGSSLSFDENVRLTKRVVDYAHKKGIWVEAELGVLAGHEDETHGKNPTFTDPKMAAKFVDLTGCDSLAIAIGTSHGAYKGDGNLRFDILKEIHALLPKTPLVLHGASEIPEKYTKILGLKKAKGIPASQIRRAIGLGICKVNVDSDARLAWTAAIKSEMKKHPEIFDPRHFLSAASREMVELYKKEIKIISG